MRPALKAWQVKGCLQGQVLMLGLGLQPGGGSGQGQ